jgi:predicted glycosyltransferase
MTRPRVLFYVQHLLGIGHLRRASVLARAMEAAGLAVTLAQGGRPVAGFDPGASRTVQLPPAEASDSSFSVILDAAGRPIDDAWRAARRERLLGLFAEVAPAILLIEQFPFGRRAFRFELLPLLEAAHARRPRPAVVASVRDILVAKADPKRAAEMVALAKRYFDAVLVHGDPRILPLEASFPAAAELGRLLRYTGYVVERAAPPVRGSSGSGEPEVLVSVGGGAVGRPLLEAALAARPLSRLAGAPWRLIAGQGLADHDYAALAQALPAGVALERFRPDFRALLGRARVSVSQGGYNTLMEVLEARARAVIVPFAEAAETEQTLRARRFAGLGLIELLDAAELSPARLAAAIDRAEARAPAPLAVDLEGASASARQLLALAAERAARP